MSDSLENYELGETLGPGVWRALCVRGRIRGRCVTLKTTVYSSPEQLTRLEQAAALQRSVHHPAIVSLFSSFATTLTREARQENTFVQVLELCDGKSLASRRQGWTHQRELDIRTWICPLVDAVRTLQKEPLVHGAICPDTVLFTSDGRPKLAWSTEAYKAQANSDSSPDLRDLAHLMIWFLSSTDWLPHIETSDEDMPRLPPDVSRPLRELIRSMLCQDSSQIRADDILHHPFIKTNTTISDRFSTETLAPSKTVVFTEHGTDIAKPLHSRPAKLALPSRLPNSLRPTPQPKIRSISHAPLQDISNALHHPLVSRETALVAEKTRAIEPFALPNRRPPLIAYPPSPPMTTPETFPKLKTTAETDYLALVQSRQLSRNITPQNGVPASVALDERTRDYSLSAKGLTPRVVKTGGGSFTIQANGSLLVDLRESDRRARGKGNEVFLVNADGSEVQVFTAPHLSVPCVLSEPTDSYPSTDLPMRYDRTFAAVRDFIDGLRRRTSKASISRGLVSCSLMMNEPQGDIEVKFLEPESSSYNRSESHRIVISRSRKLVEISSVSRGAVGHSKRTCALHAETNSGLPLATEDQKMLTGEEKSRMKTAVKFLQLWEAYEYLNMDDEAEPEQTHRPSEPVALDDIADIADTESMSEADTVTQDDLWSKASLAVEPASMQTRSASKLSFFVSPRPRMASCKF